jgi:predicted DCC family thiol-disulfide oxidoreductase YuxK
VQGELVFDGDCGFCTAAARWIERRWPAGRAAATPWQHIAPERLGELGLVPADVATQVWWVDERGVRGGARAVSAALIAAEGGWAALGRVIDAPLLRGPASGAYRLVARYRHWLPGGTPTCQASPS